MRFFKHRGENRNTHPAHFLKKVALFEQLIEAGHFLNENATEEQAFYMATTALLAIVDIDTLRKVVATANSEAEKKENEITSLEQLFNAPTTTINNN